MTRARLHKRLMQTFALLHRRLMQTFALLHRRLTQTFARLHVCIRACTRDCMMMIISAPSKRWVHPAPHSPVCTRQRETAGMRICVKNEPRICVLESSDGYNRLAQEVAGVAAERSRRMGVYDSTHARTRNHTQSLTITHTHTHTHTHTTGRRAGTCGGSSTPGPGPRPGPGASAGRWAGCWAT